MNGSNGAANGHQASIDTSAFKKDVARHLIRFVDAFSPPIITRAAGSYLYDEKDTPILDYTGGQMSLPLGHGHPEIVRVVSEHAQHLDHTFSGLITPPVVDLAKKLASTLPAPLTKSAFYSTGSEVNECAIKLAKAATGHFEIVGVGGSYHGASSGVTGPTYATPRKGAPMMPGNMMLAAPNAYTSPFRKADGSYDWETELEYGWNLIDRQTTGALAAVLIEPAASSGNMVVPPLGFIKKLQEHAHKRGALLIVDEAQSGPARSGTMWGFQQHDIVPDIMTCCKGLGNGYALAAIVTSPELEEKACNNGFYYYTTHVADPLPAAVGLKTLEILERDNLVQRAAKMGSLMRARLEKLQEEYECISEIRGMGTLLGIEVVTPGTKTPNVDIGNAIMAEMLKLGMLSNVSPSPRAGACIRMAPPLNISDEDLEKGLSIYEQAFATVCGQHRRK